MSDTPKTDALSATFYLRCDECPQPDKCERMLSMHPDDARDIERKLTAASAEIERLERYLARSQSAEADCAAMLRRAESAERQRDEAIALAIEALDFTEHSEECVLNDSYHGDDETCDCDLQVFIDRVQDTARRLLKGTV